MKRSLVLGMSMFLATVLVGQEFKLGSKVSNFTIQDPKGNAVSLSSLKGVVTVVMFIATKCPISNDYNERMKDIYADYTSKGVKFVAINSNSSEPAAEVEQHAAANGFPFQVYKDQNNVVADRFGAQVTPETFVLDQAGTILYHGYIDDSRNPANIKVQGLRVALDAALTGRSPERAETKAFGCTIKRNKAS